MSKTKTSARNYAARVLMTQADDVGNDGTYWMFSALAKLTADNPNTTLRCLMRIVCEQMPKTLELYNTYVQNT